MLCPLRPSAPISLHILCLPCDCQLYLDGVAKKIDDHIDLRLKATAEVTIRSPHHAPPDPLTPPIRPYRERTRSTAEAEGGAAPARPAMVYTYTMSYAATNLPHGTVAAFTALTVLCCSESSYRWMPRLHLLCARYKLSDVERAIMHIITIVQVSPILTLHPSMLSLSRLTCIRGRGPTTHTWWPTCPRRTTSSACCCCGASRGPPR